MLFQPLGLPYKHTEHEGIPLPACIPQGRFAEISQSHKTRADDVYIATYPKSGTTWLQHIVNQMLGEPRGKDIRIDQAIPWPGVETQDFIDNLSSPRYFKTHMKWRWVPKGDGVKYIYCYRNPKDVVVSYYHHTQNFKYYDFKVSLDEYFRQIFMDEKAATHGSYFDHVAEWLEQKDNKNILFMTYEDMSEDLLGEVNRIDDFLDLQLDAQTKSDIVSGSNFESMKSNDKSNYGWKVGPLLKEKTFLRKGKVGGWVSYLNKEQSDEIEQKVNNKLMPLGAKIRYLL